MSWLKAKNTSSGSKSTKGASGALAKARKTFRETTLPLISPRKGRRILRREQLFGVVRESLIRGGVISSSYTFKVLTLDSNADSFLVLMDLAIGAKDMPDEYLLEIERWIQQSAKARHGMVVRSVYWRRVPSPDQVNVALRASMPAQARRPAEPARPTAIPRPPQDSKALALQAVSDDEIEAFRRALRASASAPAPLTSAGSRMPATVGESNSDFAALSETQYGKL